MKRLLVALDASPRAPLVLAAADRLAELVGAKMIVFRAVMVPPDMPRDVLAMTDLPLEGFDPLPFLARHPTSSALVALGLANPAPQRLRRAADLGGDRADRSPLRGVLALVLKNHSDRALANLRRIGWCLLRHGSILSRVGASDKPGAVQCNPHHARDDAEGDREQLSYGGNWVTTRE